MPDQGDTPSRCREQGDPQQNEQGTIGQFLQSEGEGDDEKAGAQAGEEQDDSGKQHQRRNGAGPGGGRWRIAHGWGLPRSRPPARCRRTAHQISAPPAAPITSLVNINRAKLASTIISCGSKPTRMIAQRPGSSMMRPIAITIAVMQPLRWWGGGIGLTEKVGG